MQGLIKLICEKINKIYSKNETIFINKNVEEFLGDNYPHVFLRKN